MEPKPTYTPTDTLPVITDQHIEFLDSMRGHTWISDMPLFSSHLEQLLNDSIAAVKEYRRMMEQWQ